MAKKIIIIGGGFAGMNVARNLKGDSFDVLLIDKNNYHQFQPLFYQVATAGLEPAAISFPLRKFFHGDKNIKIRIAEVLQIDAAQNFIETTIGKLEYDYLIIATGADTNFFGNKAMEEKALPMKSVSEAVFLRNRILQNFEDVLTAPEADKEGLMNIVVVGGGATGVEVSGALSDMRAYALPKDYPEIDFKQMNIYLIEAGEKTLAAMSAESSKKSKEYLEKLGVNIMLKTSVKDFDGKHVLLSDGKTINTSTVVWAAGIKGNVLPGLSPDTITKGNRIKVDRFNAIEGYKNIFAIGDLAWMSTPKYPNGHPQVGNVAVNQGKRLGQNLIALSKGKAMKEFEYKDLGSMATVGRKLAVVDLPFAKFQGFFAWLTWMFVHLMLLLGVKNKLFTLLNWAWSYIAFDQSLRLIIKPYQKKGL
ncbi:MAG: NAD(P)/FAD-dependent oxidoreductase [Cytophagaceae bacterium]|nr:NAD(P)/FAD-dependent oxidoreductase [Cytophagaceae bacterium]